MNLLPTHPNQVTHLEREYSSTRAKVQWSRIAPNDHQIYFWLRKGAFSWTLKECGSTKSEKEAKRQLKTLTEFIQNYY